MPIGQVIWGVRDLEVTSALVESEGLTVVDGGIHPGLGTANRVVPLGESYLELLGVVEESVARQNQFGQSLLAATRDSDQLVRWSIRCFDIDSKCERLGLSAEQRTRLRPDGSLLTWRAAGLELSLRESWLPFFMQWDDADQFPGSIAVRHARGQCRISSLELTPADPSRFELWTAAELALPTVLTLGPPGLHAVTIATDDGDIVFRS